MVRLQEYIGEYLLALAIFIIVMTVLGWTIWGSAYDAINHASPIPTCGKLYVTEGETYQLICSWVPVLPK